KAGMCGSARRIFPITATAFPRRAMPSSSAAWRASRPSSGAASRHPRRRGGFSDSRRASVLDSRRSIFAGGRARAARPVLGLGATKLEPVLPIAAGGAARRVGLERALELARDLIAQARIADDADSRAEKNELAFGERLSRHVGNSLSGREWISRGRDRRRARSTLRC